MTDDIVRLCVIGVGRAGMVHARNLRDKIPHAALIAVADADESAAAQAARELEVDHFYRNYMDILEDGMVDAVCIACPTFTHAEIAIAAARAGKHVFCEKPMAVTLDEADRMIEAAESAGVKLQIGFMRRFDQGFQEARKLIQDGAIGDLVLIKSTGRGPGLPAGWYLDFDKSNGLLAEVNSHDFDTVRWLSGSEFARVYAEGGAFARPDIKDEHPGFFDSALVSIRLTDGKMAVIDGTCPSNYGYDARTEVLGTKGVLMIGQFEEQSVVICRKDGTLRPTTPSWRNRFKDAYREEMAHFVRCIRDGTDPAVAGLDGKKALEGVLAANRSLEEGQPVCL